MVVTVELPVLAAMLAPPLRRVSAEVLAEFERAALIRDMFFRRGGSAPSLSFSLKPVYLDANVRSMNLEIEGQSYVYRHGPARRQSAQWPGPEPGLVRVDETRAARIEDESERIGTTGRCVASVFDIGNAADFHPRHSVTCHQSTNFR